MGLAGALLPVAVKERFPDRAGFGTSGYVLGINGGAAIAAVLAVPIAHAAGGWRASLVAFSAVAAGLLVVWLVLTRGGPPRRVAAERPPLLPLRSPVGWWLVLLFGTMSVTFYGLNAWLPDAYVEEGWSESSAGALVGVLNVLTVVPVVFVALLSDRLGSRRPYLVGASALFLGGADRVRSAPGGRVGLGRDRRARHREHVPARHDAPPRRRRAAGPCRCVGRDDAGLRLRALGVRAARPRRRAGRDRVVRRGALAHRRVRRGFSRRGRAALQRATVRTCRNARRPRAALCRRGLLLARRSRHSRPRGLGPPPRRGGLPGRSPRRQRRRAPSPRS